MAGWIVRRRTVFLVAWIVVLLVLAAGARKLPGRLDAGTRIPGSGSALVQQLMQSEFDSPLANPLLLVMRGLPGRDSAATRKVVGAISARVRNVRGVTAVISESDPRGMRENGAAVLIVGIDSAGSAAAGVLARLRALTRDINNELHRTGYQPTLRWTGYDAVSLDLRHAGVRDARRSELRALPIMLLLLVLAFGSLAAAMLPLLLGGLSIIGGLGLAYMLSAWWEPALLLQNVVSVLGLALGVDYALLIVTRFREALHAGDSPDDAAIRTARVAGKTILLSGATVALGFAALLLVKVDEIRSVAVGGIAVVSVAVLLATTLLPGMLSWIGNGVERLPIPGRGRLRQQSAPRWNAWGVWVTRHPVLVVLAVGVPLLLLAVPATRLSTNVPRDWLPREMESARALQDLAELGRDDLFNSMAVVLRLPRQTTASDAIGWRAMEQLGLRLQQDRRVASTQSLPTIAARFSAPRQFFLALLPDSVRRLFVSRDGGTARLEVRPRAGISVGELADFVREIRTYDAAQITGVAGAKILVGGAPAVQADYEDAVAAAFPRVIATVLLGIFIALAVGFRSLVIPLKATALNLLSVGAAFGALVLVFQDGHGARLFGLAAPLAGVFPAVPVLVFAIVFGLSMDYEVFLVRRVAEERECDAGITNSEAIVAGLTHTARLITNAAAIMVAIFITLAFGEYLPARLLGFTLAVAVVADATVVRLALGPALLKLAGHWNWWPGERGEPRQTVRTSPMEHMVPR